MWALCDGHRERWMRSYADYNRGMAEMAPRQRRGRGQLLPGRAAFQAAARRQHRRGDDDRRAGHRGRHAREADRAARCSASRTASGRPSACPNWAHPTWWRPGRRWRRRPGRRPATAVFDAAYADGLGLGLEAGIDYALGEPDRTRPPEPTPGAGHWAPLTRREREVAVLVAEGLTNQQIADRLLIGRRTANTHLEHILTKLDFTSRAQIAAWVAAQQRGT
jgi:non-specific serine/threonine protein kinase